MTSIRGSEGRIGTGLVLLLYCFVVFSGIAALIYEVSWTKMLALTFGRSTLAVTAVVGGFMMGMGIGAWLYHRAQDARIHPIKIYAALEFGIALVTALLTPVFGALPEFFASAASLVPAGLAMDIFRTAFVVLILLVPAALMGATFPALCSVLIRSREGVSQHLGPIYGINTVGAALGAMIAGFVLMEWLGLAGSVRVANGINIVIGSAAWLLSSRIASRSLDDVTHLDDAEAILPTELPTSVTAIALFVSGFATLSYEIVWFRALGYLFGIGAYALTVMLVVFLVGLGLGGLLAMGVRRQHAPARVLGVSQLGIAFFAMMAIGAEYLLLSRPDLWALFSVFSIGESSLGWQYRMVLAVLIALLMMLPATLLMGLSFPIASRLFLGDVRRLGERVGAAYLLANLGSVIGAGTAAFVVLPYLGTIRGTLAIAFANILLGVLVLVRSPNGAGRNLAWAIPPTIALLAMSILLPAQLPFPILYKNFESMDLLWSEEGDVATVQVWASRDSPDQRGIFVDGTSIGESKGLRRIIWGKQRLLAHLSMALAPGSKTSLNVGLGSGSTLGALASYPEVERLDVVEISGAVVRASQGYFADTDVLNDPRVNLDVEDIAHFLLRGDSLYDLIISDGKLVEWFSGNELMLCRDFYEQSKQRLTEDGIFVQWIGLTHPTDAFKIIMRTFLASFPETEVFLDSSTGLYLVGSRLPIGRNRAEQLDGGVASEDLAVLDIPDMSALMSRWLVGGQQLRSYLGEGQLSTWDHPAIEFAINRSDASSLQKARGPNLELLLEAKSLGGTHPYLSEESPYIQSNNLVTLTMLAIYRENAKAAIRFAQEAARANPMDPNPNAILKMFGQPEVDPQ